MLLSSQIVSAIRDPLLAKSERWSATGDRGRLSQADTIDERISMSMH
ncbi:hypothetical protein [Phormidesmis priestleyi]